MGINHVMHQHRTLTKMTKDELFMVILHQQIILGKESDLVWY